MVSKKKYLIIAVFILLSSIPCSAINASSIMDDPTNYKTIDELKKELQEERKRIEDEKLQQLREKQREKELEKATQLEENPPIDEKNDSSIKIPEGEKTNEEIPGLIVRLRGKHSSKYLCSYNFIIDNRELSKNIINDYSTLLKKPSLKVRANEIINFQFTKEPRKIKIFRWGEEEIVIRNKKGSIRVPDIEDKIVIGVEAIYKEGTIRYAVVLDIRK